MRLLLAALFVLGSLTLSYAQRPALTPKQDSSLVFPLIRGSRECGVLPVKDVDFIIDPRQDYKVMLDVTVWSKDSLAAYKMNPGLEEIGRELNLHLYAGVPLTRISMAAAFHGMALRSLLTNEAYRKLNKTDNPNIALVEELQKAGVTLIACGQALSRRGFEKKDLLPGVRLAVSAKTTSSYFQSRGYGIFFVNEE